MAEVMGGDELRRDAALAMDCFGDGAGFFLAVRGLRRAAAAVRREKTRVFSAQRLCSGRGGGGGHEVKASQTPLVSRIGRCYRVAAGVSSSSGTSSTRFTAAVRLDDFLVAGVLAEVAFLGVARAAALAAARACCSALSSSLAVCSFEAEAVAPGTGVGRLQRVSTWPRGGGWEPGAKWEAPNTTWPPLFAVSAWPRRQVLRVRC